MKHLPSLAALFLLASCQRLDIATPLTSEFPLVQYSQAPGVFAAAPQVSLSVPAPASEWEGTKIIYTTNPAADMSRGEGSDYSGPITVANTGTLRARLVFGPKVGPESGAAYVLTGDIPPVTFSPTGGLYYNDVNLTLSTTSEILAVGGSIKATFDGSDPNGGTVDYSAPIALPFQLGNNEIRAASFVNTGANNGPIKTETYQFQVAKPVLTPPPGTYPIAQSVVVTTATMGANLYYTHGATPADPTTVDTAIVNGSTYSVTASETLKVKGFRALYGDSEVAEGLYTISGGVNITIQLQIPVEGVTGTLSVTDSELIRASSETATITSNISGGTVAAYQWYVNGAAVPGATAGSFTLATTNAGVGSSTDYSDLAVGNYYIQLKATINGQDYLVPDSSAAGSQIYIVVKNNL